MRIATGTVSYDGYHRPAANERLINLCARALQLAGEQGAELVCLPAGYLIASGEDERDQLSERAVAEAQRSGVGVALGIDLSAKKLRTDCTQQIRENRLPWFAVCWSPSEGVAHCWRQRSTNSRDCRAASDQTCAEQRTLRSLGGNVEVLMCGEIFNPRIRANIANRRHTIRAVVDLGHQSEGFRVFQGMRALSRRGLVVLCSVHTERRLGQKYKYDPGGVRRSSRHADICLGDGPRIELKVWDI